MKKKRNGRPNCTICVHPERARAEMLCAGASIQSVAKKFGMSYSALHRHWRNHVSDERKILLKHGPVSRMALAARVNEEAGSVLDNLKIIRASLWHMLSMATEAGDANGVAILAGRLQDNLSVQAKLTGELAKSPLVQNNNTILVSSPEFAELQAALIKALVRHPDARRDVIAVFSALEMKAAAAVDPRNGHPAPLVLEHQP